MSISEILILHNAFDSAMRPVASVQIDETEDVHAALERAYVLTNTINFPWWENGTGEVEPNFRVTDVGGCRSTSMGDIAMVTRNGEGTFYHCAAFGWEELTSSELSQHIRRQEKRIEEMKADGYYQDPDAKVMA